MGSLRGTLECSVPGAMGEPPTQPGIAPHRAREPQQRPALVSDGLGSNIPR